MMGVRFQLILEIKLTACNLGNIINCVRRLVWAQRGHGVVGEVSGLLAGGRESLRQSVINTTSALDVMVCIDNDTSTKRSMVC